MQPRELIEGERLRQSLDAMLDCLAGIAIFTAHREQARDEHPRNGGAFVIFKHHFAPLVSRMGEEGYPAPGISRNRKPFTRPQMMVHQQDVIAASEADCGMVQCAATGTKVPLRLRGFPREIRKVIVDSIYRANCGSGQNNYCR